MCDSSQGNSGSQSIPIVISIWSSIAISVVVVTSTWRVDDWDDAFCIRQHNHVFQLKDWRWGRVLVHEVEDADRLVNLVEKDNEEEEWDTPIRFGFNQEEPQEIGHDGTNEEQRIPN